MLCIKLGVNSLYQRANVGAPPKFVKGETVVMSDLVASVVEDHVAFQSIECLYML